MAENYQDPIFDSENETTLGNAIVAENDLAPNDDPRLDPILPSQMTSAQKLPSDHDMTMAEAMRQYRITQTTIDQRMKGPETHFWGNAAKGIKDFGQEIKAFPDKFDAAIYRAFDGHLFPDMTEDEAVRLMEASTRIVSHDSQMRNLVASYEGADGSIVRPFFSGAAQVVSYGLVGALTGGVGIGIMAGVQEATDISQEMAEKYMKDNDGSLQGYKGSEDAIFAAAHGAVSGYIETFFGVEKLFTNAIKKTGIRKIGESILRSAAGEGTEEFLQEASKYLFENMAGRNDRTFGEFLKDAVVNAAYGAALGGAFGGAMYYPNVRRIKKALVSQGYTEEQAKVLAPAIVNEAKEGMLKEVDDRAQIREHYGEQWDNLKNKIVVALENAGWRESNPDINLEKYAEDNADDIVRPLFRFSNKYGIDTRDLIQLADIDVIDNAIYLRPGDLGTPETIANRIKEKQAQVKRLTMLAKTGAGDPDAKRSLNTQIELLQKYYEKQTGDRFNATRRVRAAKAKMDAEILATTAPAVSETIANIDITQMSSGEPTTQIRERLDGQPFVYVGDKQLPVEYKVVPMDEVIASHTGQDINTNYTLKELQNRAQRGTRTDVSILQSRAAKIQPENLGIAYNTQNGAPVVNDKGEVIAGNGRYEVLRMTNPEGRARYNKYLESLGLDLTGIKDPILVRVMHNLTPEQQIAVADASNVSATSAFDNASQAAQDAKLLKGTNGITDFLNKIPIESRQGLFLGNDRVNKVALDRRYNDALMMWLLNNDTALYEELYLMGGISQKIQTALNQVIPGLMSLENQYPVVGLRQDLANALKRLPSIARSQDFAFAVSQTEIDDGRPDLFNENALLYALTFGKNTKTWEGSGPDRLQVGLTLTEFFDSYTQMATTNQEQQGQVDIFGQPLAAERTKADILSESLTMAFPREFEDGTAKSRDMRAVFLTRAQTAPTQLNQMDLLDTVQPSLFPDDTSTASAVKNLPWEKPVNVSNPTFFNRMPDATDIEIAKNNGIDAFLILDKSEMPTKLVLLDGSVVGLKPGAKVPSGAELYKPTKQLFQQEFRDAHSAPSNDGTLVKERLENGGDFSLAEVALGQHNQPSDYFSAMGPRMYGYDTVSGRQSFAAINSVIRGVRAGRKDMTITAYRAIPKDIDVDTLINRDWISFSEQYVKDHGESRFGEGEYKIIKQEVPITDVWWDGNDINEWGYDSSSSDPDAETTQNYEKLNPVLKDRLKNYDNIQEFYRDFSIITNLEKNGATINPDGTITLYHSGNVSDILRDGKFIGTTAPKGGMTGYESKSVFFSFDKSWSQQWNHGGTSETIAINVPIEYVKQPAQNEKEVYIDGNVVLQDKDKNIWVSDTEIKDNFYTKLPAKFNKEMLNSIFNKYGPISVSDQLFQGRRVNGFYDPELEVIVLGRNSNTGTLPHEMAHYWANTIFNLVKSGKYNNNPDFMAQAMGMFRMLGVGMNQDILTRDQQEQFATMTESVIFGMAPIPQGTELPMTAFLNWVPAKYKSILDIGYRNSEGKIVNPILDKQAVEWFNAWYGNGNLPAIDASPLEVENTNAETGERILPSTAEVMKVRATEIKTESDNLKRAREEMQRETTEATPTSERAAAAGAEVMIESQPGNIERSEPPAEKKRGIMSYLIPGRGTNTREGMFAAARDYIKNNPDHANEVAFGSPATTTNDTGIDRAILIRALMENYKQGDPEYAELYHNLAETVSLAGKTPGLSNDMNFQYYLEAVRRISDGMEGVAAIKYAGTRNLNKARRTFNSDLDAFIQEHANRILNTAPDTEKREMLIKQMLAEASVKFSGDTAAQLNQEELRRGRSIKSADRAVFTEWANREIRKMLKATPDTDIINRTMELSEKAEKARKYLDSNDIAEVQAAGKTIREWQLFVAEKEVPETWASKLIGSWYPKAMLYNINTHLVNMTGNTFNYGIVHAAVAAQYKEGNKVSKQSLDAEKERLHRLYDASLMNLAAMETPTSPTLLHGEQYNPREGKSTIGKVADFSMDLLGKEDAIFRIRAYLDALGHIATADAVKTGGSPTELFNEYKKINNPKGTRAYEARLEALRISDIAVFQQTGVLSSALKKVRDALNFGQRGGLGTLLGPFVKTPANIVEQGARAIAAPITSGWHALQGKWSIQDTMDTGYFALACILTMGLMADYEPPYEVPQRYDPNKPYDSIRIRGTDTWIKLDTFAAASVPLRIITSIATGKGLGVGGAFDEIPLIGDLADAYGEAARIEKDPYKQGVRFGANWAYNRVNTAVPAIIKYTLAAMHPADLHLDELDIGLPKTGIGRKIGRQYGLAGGDTTTNDILRIFFNRLKIYKE